MGKAIAVTMALLALACGSPTGPTEDDGRPGLLRIGSGGDIDVDVPASVTAGRPFEVSLRSWGPDSCWSVDRTDVSVTGLSAAIRPFDRYDDPGPGRGCYFSFVKIEHVADVRFDVTGTAELTIRGRSYSGDVVVSRTIEVLEE